MRDKILLHGAARPDDELWGLNAPFGFGVGGRPVPFRASAESNGRVMQAVTN